ncbi:MAG: TonB-dependent receptor [Burkholderiales bacterium]|nr:TonB-dependent receptor [Burkholderiales bacterium]
MDFGTKTPMKTLVACLATAGLASFTGAVQAQADQRITITGSSIKRIATEGALPIQVITRVELERQGIVSAEQVIATLTSNGNGLDNLASNADVVTGQSRGNNGASSANLRNQGANATLILLNGRRIAAHGLNGGVVDLNQIPMAAVERIEVLKDGASSTYGTDAVGGVINFILRNNYTGLQAAATADVTEAGGGNIYRASVVGGLGNLAADGWNLLASLSVTDHKKLKGSERDFVNTFQPERGLSPDTRGAPFATLFAVNTTLPNLMTRPGGAGTPAANGTAPILEGVVTNGINTLDLPGAAGCASQPDMGPYDQLLWAAGAGARYGCAWDTGKAAVIQQPVRNTNLVTRGSFKLGDHTLIGEVLLGKSESAKSFSENQITTSSTTANITLGNGTVVASPFRDLVYPSTGVGYTRVANALIAAFPVLAGNLGNSIAFRWRCLACGPREIETETDTSRVLLGLEGALPWISGFDYRVGASHASSKSKSTLGSGYHYGLGFSNLIKNGTLNPFLLAGEAQTPAAMAALEAVSARGVELYDGTFTMTQIDAVASGPVFKLPAGDVLLALGADLRTEKYKFNGNNSAGFSSIDTWVFNAPFDNINALGGVKRDVKAVFGEVIVPLHKTLEVNLSARYDEYTGFGSTTNPKASFRFQPLAEFVARGSYGTGFRVPTFNQLYNGVTESAAPGAGNVDPARCPSLVVNPAPGSPCNAITFNTLFGGKPDLGPEESKMSSLGFVWQPVPQFSASLDWWDIKREGTIQSFSLATFMANYALFPERFIRDPVTGEITAVDIRWANAGETVTKGIDVSLRAGENVGPGRLTGGLDISYLLEKKSRLLTSTPFGPSEVARFTRADDLGIRWKHAAFITYRQGDWSGTLTQLYRSKYAGFVPPGVANGSVLPSDWDPVVKPYSIYHLSASYSGIPNLTLTAGVKNVLDTDPPYANSYDTNTGSGSSWEPRVADPRGRSYVLTVEYKFF